VTKKHSARPLTESAVALALGGIMWWAFSPMPGIGPYFKYISASLIAIVGARHGLRWSLVTAAALNALVGFTFGPGELLNCLFLVTPIALMLPARQRTGPGCRRRRRRGRRLGQDAWGERREMVGDASCNLCNSLSCAPRGDGDVDGCRDIGHCEIHGISELPGL